MKRRGLLAMLAAAPAAVLALTQLRTAGASRVHRADGIRLSTQPADRGYKHWASGGRYSAYCDGVRLKQCVMADELLGEAKCIACDANGVVLIDRLANDCRYVMHYGNIEIRASDELSRKLLRIMRA